ncbi:MAG: 30S ribosomal protein S8 [Parcubacteria group bacterium GW2011_GWA2_47_8]|nr:MAG: 30S ribosomal protein S8 [Parcubacteria group bacterium GW2011_GWA2_47_8]
MLTTLKNAVAAHKSDVVLKYTKINHEIVKILHAHKYISDVSVKKLKNDKAERVAKGSATKSSTDKSAAAPERQELVVRPHYIDGSPMINNIRRISKPSRRLYAKSHELRDTRQGFGMWIVSTSKGIMTGADAHKQNLGGEIIAEVW